MEGWLDQNSLARFVVEVVEQLDTQAIEKEYTGGGSAPYPPKMMLALIFYCYAKGIFSSRQIEQASYELIPVLYITGGTHPDHDSINTFRKRFLKQMPALFAQILEYACSLGIFKLGDISIDGSKFKANASKHKAMSWDYACKIEEQLKGEVEALMGKAESELGTSSRDIDIPQELQRREERLEKLKEIKAELEKRAPARYDQEKAEYDSKMAELDKLPESLGKVEKAALDSGFFSEHNTQHFEAKGIEPYIASGRQNHYPSLEERLAAPPPQAPDALAAMNHRLKTDEGRQFYAQRKSTRFLKAKNS